MSRATLGELGGQPAPRSFFRERLARRAGSESVESYLLEQANHRGFFGAFGAGALEGPVDRDLSLEEIVVGLTAPQAEVDGRLFKLVLRILQSGRIDPRRLRWLARKERSDRALVWLLERVPAEELNEPVAAIRGALGAIRGYRPLAYEYDPRRLLRRPFRLERAWRTRRS